MRKALSCLWILSLSACAGGGMQSTSPIPSVPASVDRAAQTAGFASTNWSIGTGASDHNFAVQDLDFYPNAITINAGDTVSYHVASGSGGDAHTVSFFPAGAKVPTPFDPNDVNPYGGSTVDGTHALNSGILAGGQVFTLNFPTPGTYRILCLFHEPAMVMTVVVQRTGTPYPHTAAYYANAAQTERWDDLNAGFASISSFPFKPGGTTLAAGISPGLVHFPPADSTVLRFLDIGKLLSNSGNMTIKVGTVLTWVNESSNEPHTVTFNVAGQSDLPPIPPDPAVNVVAPPGITDYDGSKIVNSGTFAPGQKFQLRFTKAGQFYYGCVYHDNSLMEGRVTVMP